MHLSPRKPRQHGALQILYCIVLSPKPPLVQDTSKVIHLLQAFLNGIFVLYRCLLEHSNSGEKSFDSILFDSRYRIDFFRFDLIQQSDKFAACTLIFK